MIETVAALGLPVGERILIRKNRIAGAEGGGRICVVSGIHGDELEGQYICYELARRLQEARGSLTGTVDIYPALNPLGIDTRQRAVPQIDMDMNRIFPGQKDGTVMEQIAAAVVDDLAGASFCLDIHSSNVNNREITQVRISQDFKDKLLPYARLLNTDMIWMNATETVHESTLAHSMNMLGVPTLVVEMGIGARIEMRYGDQIVEGILNLMRRLGMWAGEVGQIREPVIVPDADICFIRAQREGIFLPCVTHETKVREGQEIGRVVDALRAQVQETVVSPCDGLVFTLREYPVIYEGALLARILRSGALHRQEKEE